MSSLTGRALRQCQCSDEARLLYVVLRLGDCRSGTAAAARINDLKSRRSVTNADLGKNVEKDRLLGAADASEGKGSLNDECTYAWWLGGV